MKKILPFVAIVFIIAVVVGVIVVGKNSDSTDDMKIDPSSPLSSGNEVATNQVKIVNMAFSPRNITVKKGTTVTWTNNDSVAHTVTQDAEERDGPTSGTVNPGESYSFTFNTVGTLSYHCEIHHSMAGVVTVTE